MEHPINSIEIEVVMSEPLVFKNGEKIRIDSITFVDSKDQEHIISFDEQGCDIANEEEPAHVLIDMCAVSEGSDFIGADILYDSRIDDIRFSCPGKDEEGKWHVLGKKPIDVWDFKVILNSRSSVSRDRWLSDANKAFENASAYKLQETSVKDIDLNLLRDVHDDKLYGIIEIGTVFYGNDMFKLYAEKYGRDVMVTYNMYSPYGDYACGQAEEKNFEFKLKPDELDRGFYIISNGSGEFTLNTPHLWDINEELCKKLQSRGMISYENLPAYNQMRMNKTGFFQQLDKAIKEYPILQLSKKTTLTEDEVRGLAAYYDKKVYDAYRMDTKEIASKMIEHGFSKNNVLKIGSKMESVYEGLKPDWIKETFKEPEIKKLYSKIQQERNSGR